MWMIRAHCSIDLNPLSGNAPGYALLYYFTLFNARQFYSSGESSGHSIKHGLDPWTGPKIGLQIGLKIGLKILAKILPKNPLFFRRETTLRISCFDLICISKKLHVPSLFLDLSSYLSSKILYSIF
jgi:hypothetical protein